MPATRSARTGGRHKPLAPAFTSCTIILLQILLRAPRYSAPIDMFAFGCIMAEMFALRPLFPGASEADQLVKMCKVLGTPTKVTWLEGCAWANKLHIKLPQFAGVPLSTLVPQADADGLDLMVRCLTWNPSHRISAAEALQHPFFTRGFAPIPTLAPAIAQQVHAWKPTRIVVPDMGRPLDATSAHAAATATPSAVSATTDAAQRWSSHALPDTLYKTSQQAPSPLDDSRGGPPSAVPPAVLPPAVTAAPPAVCVTDWRASAFSSTLSLSASPSAPASGARGTREPTSGARASQGGFDVSPVPTGAPARAPLHLDGLAAHPAAASTAQLQPSQGAPLRRSPLASPAAGASLPPAPAPASALQPFLHASASMRPHSASQVGGGVAMFGRRSSANLGVAVGSGPPPDFTPRGGPLPLPPPGSGNAASAAAAGSSLGSSTLFSSPTLSIQPSWMSSPMPFISDGSGSSLRNAAHVDPTRPVSEAAAVRPRNRWFDIA
ncbi:MAG: hypothetical protein EOO41_03510, partial [Methanobacteriota archaeon]